MHIKLRANEKIYINGAVLRPDRKTSIELLNDAVFLLEGHVMQEKDATTPLKQLYFIVQVMLMEHSDREDNRQLVARHCEGMRHQYDDRRILDGVAKVLQLVHRQRYFEALKVIRSVMPIETAALEPVPLAVAS